MGRMDFNTAVQTSFQKYFTFSGRARRSEFWWFTLFVAILIILAQIIDGPVLATPSYKTGPTEMVVSFALLIPSLSVGWRRLHDTGRSGWWYGGLFLSIIIFGIVSIIGLSILGRSLIAILSIVYVVGLIVWVIMLIIFWCQDSQVNENQYGFNPK